MKSRLLPAPIVERLQEIARDQIPSLEFHDALPLIKAGWVAGIVPDTVRPGRVFIFCLTTEGTIALRDHQHEEAAAEARKK